MKRSAKTALLIAGPAVFSGDPDLVRCDRAFRGTGDRTAALDGTLVDHAPGQSGSYSITSVYCQRTVWNRSDGSGRKELFL